MQGTKTRSGFIAPQSALNRVAHYLVGALQQVARACFPVLGSFVSPGRELPEERFSLVKETEKEGSQLSTFPKQNWVEKSEFHLTPWVLAPLSAIV